ncbi:DNA-binding transcriptional MerR regulator [Microterricola gilva]|uniref:DNA-binding transcriptional MerR regulator n=1 Tax=Microterricola gilva TaxID=393267 RepID=A0A4Q8AID0_9MICO|nr:MerR family transcriptional regulator [Microterricola gilva]RZU64202.1 DNA-binding transcriptional MerR regulator [Microterricola gilva]
MFTIGEFASIGRVSVRMLRHYDEIGLLPPARVDPFSGYRYYAGTQFRELSRIVTLKELGFGLEDVATIVHGGLGPDAVHTMLLRRRAELATQLELDTTRLKRLDAHIRIAEGETIMSDPTGTAAVALRALPEERVAGATAIAPGFGPSNITPVIGPLFDRLRAAMTAAGVSPQGEAIASYDAIEDAPDGESVRASAWLIVPDDVAAGDGFTVQTLPGVIQAATIVHHGSMATIGESWQALHDWIAENGFELAGVCRERYILSQPEPQEDWVTELQQPVATTR